MKYFVYPIEKRVETTPDANVIYDGEEGEPITDDEAIRLVKEGYSTFSSELTNRANWGGKRREGKTKESINITIDTDILEFIDKLGGKRATTINKILRGHMNHVDQLIKEADELNERF